MQKWQIINQKRNKKKQQIKKMIKFTRRLVETKCCRMI
nr:MAG TPA: hypothetical protein [Caudoviricetes sp.]